MSEKYRMNRVREQERLRQQQVRDDQRRSRAYERELDQRKYEQERITKDYNDQYNKDRINTRNRIDNRRYNQDSLGNNSYSTDRINRNPQRRSGNYKYQERTNLRDNKNYDREIEYRVAEQERIERERIERIRQQDRNYNLNQKEREERVQQLQQINVANEGKKNESNDMTSVKRKKKDKGKVLIIILNILLGLLAIGIAVVGYIYGSGARDKVQIYLISEAIIVFLFIINGLRAIIKNKRILEGIFLLLGVCIMVTFMVLTIKRIFI